jgi:hypothetical protein
LLAHLAARVEHLPVALLLAVRDGPDEPELLDELRATDVLAPGSVLEFAHPIVRTAVY